MPIHSPIATSSGSFDSAAAWDLAFAVEELHIENQGMDTPSVQEFRSVVDLNAPELDANSRSVVAEALHKQASSTHGQKDFDVHDDAELIIKTLEIRVD